MRATSQAIRPPGRLGSGIAVVAVLVLAVAATGLWHLTQGTSGVGAVDLLRYAAGARESVNGVPVEHILSGSRWPRLLAGTAVGIALGAAGALLQSITRNPLASPDTLAVSSGAYFAVTAGAVLGLSLPLWASGALAFLGGLAGAAVVLSLAGRAAGTATTRLVLAGSAVAMALEAGSSMLLLLFREDTTGLYAWGSGSLAQLNIDAALRAAPVVVTALALALSLSRRLDVLRLGDDTASSLGTPIRSTRLLAVLLAVLLTAASVTLAGPIAFVGLAAPVLARLLAARWRVLHRHLLMIPVSGLLGGLLVLFSDALLRSLLTAQGAASIPTGVPTAVLGGLLIVVLALRLPDSAAARRPPRARSGLRSPAWFAATVTTAVLLLAAALVAGLLSGSLLLRLGDVALWLQDAAPALVARALDERAPRVGAAATAGAALGLAGCIVQGTVRNPLAEPGILGITAGAGLGAVIALTVLDGSPLVLSVTAVLGGLGVFGVIALCSRRGGFLPDRFVLIGIGIGNCAAALTTALLLQADPWNTPRLLTWLSGTTYGSSFEDVLPAAAGLLVVAPVAWAMRHRLDVMALDEDTPRLLGVRTAPTRFVLLAGAALLAAASVVAIGVVGFVGLVAPHLARSLVGARHARSLPVTMLLGALLVVVADALGRTLIAPAQVPAGLMIALIGAPYFVWLLRRSRA